MNEAAAERPAGAEPVTVVVGATGGVGRAVARAFEADQLVLLGRDPDKLGKVGAEFPGARAVSVDFRSPESISSAFEGLSGIDRLINCTGAIVPSRLEAAEVGDWHRMMEANVMVPLAILRIALPLLRSARGSVVFVSSGSAKRVRPGWSGYSASKYALRALAEGLELEEPELRVISIFAGAIDTPLRNGLGELKGRDFHEGDYLFPEEVAESIAFALQMRSSVSVGEVSLRVGRERREKSPHG